MPPRTRSLFHMAGSPCHTCTFTIFKPQGVVLQRQNKAGNLWISLLNLMSVIHSLGYSRKIYKTVWNLATPWKFQQGPRPMEIRQILHDFFWNTTGNSSSFLTDPLNFHIIYALSSVPLECPQPPFLDYFC